MFLQLTVLSAYDIYFDDWKGNSNLDKHKIRNAELRMKKVQKTS